MTRSSQRGPEKPDGQIQTTDPDPDPDPESMSLDDSSPRQIPPFRQGQADVVLGGAKVVVPMSQNGPENPGRQAHIALPDPRSPDPSSLIQVPPLRQGQN